MGAEKCTEILINLAPNSKSIKTAKEVCLRATEMTSATPQQAIMQQPLDHKHGHSASGSDNLNFTEAGVQRLYMARLSQLSKRYMSDAEHHNEVSSKDVKHSHETQDLAESRKRVVPLESSPAGDAPNMMLSSRQRQLRHLSPDELFVAIGVEIDAEDHIKMKVRKERRSQEKKNGKRKMSKKKTVKSPSSNDSLNRKSRDKKSNHKNGIIVRQEEIGNLESTSEISPDVGIEVLWRKRQKSGKKKPSVSDSTLEIKSQNVLSNSTNSNSEKKDPSPKRFFPSRFMPKDTPLSPSAARSEKELLDASPEKVTPKLAPAELEKSVASKPPTQEKLFQKDKETKQAELYSSPATQRGTLSMPNEHCSDQRRGTEVLSSGENIFNLKNLAKEVEDMNSRMCHSSTGFPVGDDLNLRMLETSMDSSHDLGLNTLSTSISSHDILADLAQTPNSRLCRTVTDESQVDTDSHPQKNTETFSHGNDESQDTGMLETSMESQGLHDDCESSDEGMSATSMESHYDLDDLNESRISMSSQDNFHIINSRMCFTSVDDSYDYPMPNEASKHEHSMESQDKSEVSGILATMGSIGNNHESDEESIFDFFIFPEGMDEKYLQSNARHRVKDLISIARAADASFFVTADQKTAAYAALVQYWKGKMVLNPELHSKEGMKMFSCDPDLLDEQYNTVMEKLDPQIRPWYRACS